MSYTHRGRRDVVVLTRIVGGRDLGMRRVELVAIDARNGREVNATGDQGGETLDVHFERLDGLV